MASPPRIFLSYARKDGEPFARGLRERLETEEPSITLWQDLVKMEGGVGWWNQITEALEQVRFMVLVLTTGALQSTIVRKEWMYARQQGVKIYPVLGEEGLDPATLPRWLKKVHCYNL